MAATRSAMEILAITFFPRHTRLTVRFRHHLYSGQLPTLATSLISMLPSLREHLCTNARGLSFEQELHDTELGHVFEHVMLAILADRGLCTRGQTTWNWHRDPVGTYHVTISTGRKMLVKESLLVAQALFTNVLVGPPLSVCCGEGLYRSATREEALSGAPRTVLAITR